MDFFEMMKLVSHARLHGKAALRALEKWLREHPSHPSLPGGIEAAILVANRLYAYRQWCKKQ